MKASLLLSLMAHRWRWQGGGGVPACCCPDQSPAPHAEPLSDKLLPHSHPHKLRIHPRALGPREGKCESKVYLCMSYCASVLLCVIGCVIFTVRVCYFV